MTARTLLTCFVLSATASAQAPAPGGLVINEVMADPPPGQPSANEWVEVLNVTAGPLDLGGLVLADAVAEADPLPAGTTVAAGAFLVLVRDPAAFGAAYPGVPSLAVGGFPALNNGGDRPALRLGGAEVDAVPYTSAWGAADASLERRDPLGPSAEAANWGASVAPGGGTPGAVNSLFAPDTTPPALLAAEAVDASSVRVVFSEPLDPATAEAAPNYTVDGIGPPALALLGDDDREVMLALGAPLPGPLSYRLTVRGIADRRGNVLAEASASFFVGEGAAAGPGDLVVNEVLYDTPAADDPGEFVELLNRTGAAFDLRTFTLNDGVGDDAPVTDRAAFVEPGGYAVVVEDAARFAAVFPGVEAVEMAPWSALNNSGDAVVLKQGGAVIDSLRYAPSWGGDDASLERRDPAGPSQAASNWATTTDLRGGTPGAQNTRFEPDVTGPQLVSGKAAEDGRAVTAHLDEPADPASVVAAAFSVDGGPAVVGVGYEAGATQVEVTLETALAAGTSTLVARGLVDLLGNATERTDVAVPFDPDVTPPALAAAEATSATTVRLQFTEPVAERPATEPATYAIEGFDIREADAVEVSGVGVLAVSLRLGAPLTDRTLYAVVATGLADLAGVVAERTEARFFVGTPDVPSPGDVVINEVLFDPAAGSDGEFVELLNATADAVFDLRALTLDDGGDRPLSDAPAVLLPGEPLAVVRDAEAFRLAFPDAAFHEASHAISLSNSGDAVVVRAGGVALDSVAYDPAWHRAELEDATGVSLERRSASAPSADAASWSSSLAEAGATPSEPNTVGLATGPVERETGLTITSPFAPTRGEAAAITYALAAEAAAVRCRIFDGGGRPVRELEPGRLSGPTATLVWDGTGDDRRPLRAGVYVVLVEAFDAEGAAAEALRGVVVLARPR